MTTTAQTPSEAASSRFVRIQNGELDLNLYYNDCGAGGASPFTPMPTEGIKLLRACTASRASTT